MTNTMTVDDWTAFGAVADVNAMLTEWRKKADACPNPVARAFIRAELRGGEKVIRKLTASTLRNREDQATATS